MATIKRLDIIDTTQAATGTSNTTGKPWTIYEVTARDPDTGIEVNQELRSWSPLPPGPGEYEVERDERDGRVKFWVKKPGSGGSGGGLKASVDTLRERVTLVEQNLEVIQANLRDVFTRLDALSHGGPAPAQDEPGGKYADDDDIPF
jgi:hypothetical protein